MIRYKLKNEPTQREIILVNALRDLQTMYCDVIQKYEPQTDIFSDPGYLQSKEVLNHFYEAEKETV